ncbi:MAG: hypothetical protein MPJ53_00970 [Alphaproteobacteria bacterium]|nr:hypothetical protein [Alphaproteobacteria bacterium]
MTFSAANFYTAFGITPNSTHDATHNFSIAPLGELVVSDQHCQFIADTRAPYDTLLSVFTRLANHDRIVSRSPGGRLCLTWNAVSEHENSARVISDIERLANLLNGN